MKRYTHIKTGSIYIVTGEVINATNEVDGQVMVLYSNVRGQQFVKEKKEFEEKFTPLPGDPEVGTCWEWKNALGLTDMIGAVHSVDYLTSFVNIRTPAGEAPVRLNDFKRFFKPLKVEIGEAWQKGNSILFIKDIDLDRDTISLANSKYNVGVTLSTLATVYTRVTL